MKRLLVKTGFRSSRIALVIFCASLLGWVRPELPTDTKPVKDFSQQLQHLTIEVNGALQTVQNGETLRIVRGDRLKVVAGVLKNPAAKIEAVNVIGFNSSKSKKGDDRGIEFSSFELQDRWSESKDATNWVIIATTGKETHGFVYLSMVEPVLNFAVLDVNGREVVLRDGEPFVGKPDDKVRVKRVATNVTGNDNVMVQMIPVKGRTGEYEMRFLREKLVFARLPLKLEK